MTEHEITSEQLATMRHLAHHSIEFTFSGLEAWTAVAALQLALRHPHMRETQATILRDVASTIEKAIHGLSPAAYDLLQPGWDPQQDVPAPGAESLPSEESNPEVIFPLDALFAPALEGLPTSEGIFWFMPDHFFETMPGHAVLVSVANQDLELVGLSPNLSADFTSIGNMLVGATYPEDKIQPLIDFPKGTWFGPIPLPDPAAFTTIDLGEDANRASPPF